MSDKPEAANPCWEGGPPPIAVSVVVTAFRDSAALRSCLGSVRREAVPLDAEVVLVLNADISDFAAHSRLELAGLCDQMLFTAEVGKSHALNAGVSACRGNVIAFTDDDAVPMPGWLSALTAPLLEPTRPSRLMGTGGRVLPSFPETGTPGWFRELAEERPTHFLGPRQDLGDHILEYRRRTKPPTGVPIGANCAYRREVFSRYRYDTRLGPNRRSGLRGGEDWALGHQILRDGYRMVYRPEALVHHPISPDRMTLPYVRQGFFVNGVESIRIRERLGKRKLSPFRLHLRLARAQLVLWLAGVLQIERLQLRWMLKCDYRRGRLAERGGPRSSTSYHGALEASQTLTSVLSVPDPDSRATAAR